MKTQKRKSCQTALLLSVFLCMMPYAEAEQAEDFVQLAQQFIQAHHRTQMRHLNIVIASVPANSAKPTCQHKPRLRWNGAQRVGNVSVAVECSQPKWQKYVSARVSGEVAVITNTKDLQAGEAIDPQTIVIKWIDAGQLRPQHLTRPEDTEYQSARQFVPAGTALASNMLIKQTVVVKGNAVTIISERNGIRIQMEGTALESGEIHKQIRVQNNSSGKIVHGKIISDHAILVQ